MKEKKETPASPYLYALYETVFTTMTLIYLSCLKNKKSFDDTWQIIAQTFDLHYLDLKNLKKALKYESDFFIKLSKKFVKKFCIPSDLKDLLCEVRVLYFFFLMRMPKHYARMWAIFYALLHPAVLNYPLFLVLNLLAGSVAVTKAKVIYTEENLKKAFDRLKTTGILRDVKITWEEIKEEFVKKEKKSSLLLKPKKTKSTKYLLM